MDYSLDRFINENSIDVESVDPEDQLDDLYNEWILDFHNFDDNPQMQFQKACEKFGLDSRSNIACSQLAEIRTCYLKKLLDLREQFIIHGKLPVTMDQVPTEQQHEYNTKFTRLVKMIQAVFYTTQNYVICRILADESDVPHEDAKGLEFEYALSSCDAFSNLDNLNNYQELLEYLLRTLKEHRYRRSNDWCYEQIYTEEGYATHAWKPVCTIKQFILRACHKTFNPKQWKNMTDPKDNARAAYNYLINLEKHDTEVDFPEIEPNPTIFAARNGIYIAGADTFLSYANGDSKRLKSDVVACKYFDQPFPIELFSREYRDKDWYDIKTEQFQGIFDYQLNHESPEEKDKICKIVYALIGRAVFPIGADNDNFQATLFIRGAPGTGKSTVGKVIAAWRAPEQLACVSAMCEKTFGLWEFIDKFLIICYETSQAFALPVTIYNSMVCGEPVSVARKNLKATTINWIVPMLIFGNVYPFSTQGNGSEGAARRTLTVEFLQRVMNGDPRLYERIVQDELLVLLVKCCRARLDLLKNHGDKDIWQIVPKYFRETKNRMDREINPLSAFVATSEDLMLNDNKEECYMPQVDFTELYRQFCLHNGYKFKVNTDQYLSVFQEYNIDIKQKMTKKYPPITGNYRTCDFLFGIGLRTPHNVDDNRTNDDDNNHMPIDHEHAQYNNNTTHQQVHRNNNHINSMNSNGPDDMFSRDSDMIM